MNGFKTSISGEKKFKSLKEFENYLELNPNLKNSLNGLSVKNFLFNDKYKKTGGVCVMCKSPTTFNEVTGKYNRFCSEKCIEDYKEVFKQRMRTKYGTDYFAQNVEAQKKMLNNRSISGVYRYANKKDITYTGKYELDFLEFCDKILKLPSLDITESPIVFHYVFNGNKKFYIPDFYIPTINTIVEIKGSNNHYQKRDIEIEKFKDKITEKLKGINYIKILDKNYSGFLEFLSKVEDELLTESARLIPDNVKVSALHKKIEREKKIRKEEIGKIETERKNRQLEQLDLLYNAKLRKLDIMPRIKISTQLAKKKAIQEWYRLTKDKIMSGTYKK
jgi:hypothetical protein